MAYFLQLSDVHLVAPGKKLYGTVDSTSLLRDLLDRLADAELAPSAVLVTGDVGDHGDHGDAQAYRTARTLIESYAGRTGCPVIWVNGNHDEIESFRSHILDGGVIDRVEHVDGVRLIVLDSTVPGASHGLLTPDQLDWLRTVLAGPVEPTLLLMHHPPLRCPLPGLDRDMLRNRADLAELLEGSGVSMVVTGHTHYAGAGVCGGVPVWVGGSTAAYTDVVPPRQRARTADYGSFSRIDLIDGEAVAVSIPCQQMDTVLDFQAIIDGTIDKDLLAEIGIPARADEKDRR